MRLERTSAASGLPGFSFFALDLALRYFRHRRQVQVAFACPILALDPLTSFCLFLQPAVQWPDVFGECLGPEVIGQLPANFPGCLFGSFFVKDGLLWSLTLRHHLSGAGGRS